MTLSVGADPVVVDFSDLPASEYSFELDEYTNAFTVGDSFLSGGVNFTAVAGPATETVPIFVEDDTSFSSPDFEPPALFFGNNIGISLLSAIPATELQFDYGSTFTDVILTVNGESTPSISWRLGPLDGQTVGGVGVSVDAQLSNPSNAGSRDYGTVTLTGLIESFSIIGTEFGFDTLVITPAALSGDYNEDGFVSQTDLDLVLLNWGETSLPTNWLAVDQFDGVAISQNELDAVLLNWGDGVTAAAVTVPEPGVGLVVILGLGGMLYKRRVHAD